MRKLYAVDVFMADTFNQYAFTGKMPVDGQSRLNMIIRTNPTGVNIDEQVPVIHVLYATPYKRNKAYTMLSDAGVPCAIRLETALVEEKEHEN